MWAGVAPAYEEHKRDIYASLMHHIDDTLDVALAKHIALHDMGLTDVYVSNPVQDRRTRQDVTNGVRAPRAAYPSH